MNFYEVETWRPRLSCPAEEYEKAIENWFTYVAEKKELFPGLISAKYFNKCDREANPDGYYMMILEYESPEACKALHARIRDSLEKNDGVYAEYAAKDPHSCFDIDHMNMRYMQPLVTDLWFDYNDEKRKIEKANGVNLQRFLEYETWRVADDVVWTDYENMIETWFKYVVEKKKELFEEWASASYYRQCDADGNPNGIYVMLFEYDCVEGHHAYKNRKLHSYALNDGDYATYASNDPYQFFNLDYVNIDCLQELKPNLWFDFNK